MTRFFRRFWPPFFEKTDHWLLVNYPKLWATRIHALLLALGGLAGVIGVKVLLASPKNVPDAEMDLALIYISCGLIWLGWMIGMHTFRPGKYPGGSNLQQAGIVIGGTMLLALMPFYYSIGIHHQLDAESLHDSFRAEENLLDFGGSYWTYDAHSLASSQERHDRYGPPSGDQDQLHLEKAMQLFEYYGGDLEGVTSAELMTAHYQRRAMSPDFHSEVKKVWQNHERKSIAISLFRELSDYLQFRSKFSHILLFMVMLFGLLALVFQQAHVKQFLLALLAFAVIALLVGILLFVNELTHSFHDDKFIASSILVSYLVVGMVALGSVRRKTAMRKVALTLWSLALPFLGFAFAFYLHEVLGMNVNVNMGWGFSEEYYFLFYFGLLPSVLSVLLWVGVLAPRMRRLQMQP